jgi:hypothetical protein
MQTTEGSGAVPHCESVTPVKVWVDVDRGIAPLVDVLNALPGVRTYGSCQGYPRAVLEHPAYVLCADLHGRLSDLLSALDQTLRPPTFLYTEAADGLRYLWCAPGDVDRLAALLVEPSHDH